MSIKKIFVHITIHMYFFLLSIFCLALVKIILKKLRPKNKRFVVY